MAQPADRRKGFESDAKVGIVQTNGSTREMSEILEPRSDSRQPVSSSVLLLSLSRGRCKGATGNIEVEQVRASAADVQVDSKRGSQAQLSQL